MKIFPASSSYEISLTQAEACQLIEDSAHALCGSMLAKTHRSFAVNGVIEEDGKQRPGQLVLVVHKPEERNAK